MARGSIYDNSARRADYLTRKPKNDPPKAIVTTDRSRRQTHGRETTGLETPALTVTANRTDRRNNSAQSITQPVWSTGGNASNSVWAKPGQKTDNTFYTTHENNGIIGKLKTYPTIGDIDSAIKEKENQIAGAHKDQYSAMLAGDKLAAKTAGMKIDQLNGESENLMQDKADALGIGKWGKPSETVIKNEMQLQAAKEPSAGSVQHTASDAALQAFFRTLRGEDAEKPKVEERTEWWKPASEEKAEWWKPAEDGIKPVSMEKAASPAIETNNDIALKTFHDTLSKNAESKNEGMVGGVFGEAQAGRNTPSGQENVRAAGLTPNGEAMQDTGIQTTEELAQEQEESLKRLQELLSSNGCINEDGSLNKEKIALLANPFTGGEAGVALRNETARYSGIITRKEEQVKQQSITFAMDTLTQFYTANGDTTRADAMQQATGNLYETSPNYYQAEDSDVYITVQYLTENTLFPHGGSATLEQSALNDLLLMIPDGGVGLSIEALKLLGELIDPDFNPGKVLQPGDVCVYVGRIPNDYNPSGDLGSLYSEYRDSFGLEFFFRGSELLYIRNTGTGEVTRPVDIKDIEEFYNENN